MTDDKAKVSFYGFCPTCKGLGNTRERRFNGDDTCVNGHKYPSKDSLELKHSLMPGQEQS